MERKLYGSRMSSRDRRCVRRPGEYLEIEPDARAPRSLSSAGPDGRARPVACSIIMPVAHCALPGPAARRQASSQRCDRGLRSSRQVKPSSPKENIHGVTRSAPKNSKSTGDTLWPKSKSWCHEGDVRRIIIKTEEGQTLIEVRAHHRRCGGASGSRVTAVWAAIGRDCGPGCQTHPRRRKGGTTPARAGRKSARVLSAHYPLRLYRTTKPRRRFLATVRMRNTGLV